ncbi:SAM-dependent methyltransferase [Brackiella oedipodis]|uniref:SAM-dependent methyltransferase n=1 Tax=Brackiella oedipodis TaxID=124225 RepID=UPI00048C218C|nr:SAM-dependent methyltransferase [Brackiella oedipodis]
MKTLHLIPVGLSQAPIQEWLPTHSRQMAAQLDLYIAENAKTARAFLKLVEPQKAIRDITIHTLSKSTQPSEVKQWLQAVPSDGAIGLVSEAGCPAVADPGAIVVSQAQRLNFKVRPHVGPNSILLGLMASGLDGQRFAFHGYAPIKPHERTQQLKQWESDSHKLQQTQIFIETPYRNQAMLETLISSLKPDTRLCVARDLTGPQELIQTYTVAQWRQQSLPDLNKLATLFLFLA